MKFIQAEFTAVIVQKNKKGRGEFSSDGITDKHFLTTYGANGSYIAKYKRSGAKITQFQGSDSDMLTHYKKNRYKYTGCILNYTDSLDQLVDPELTITMSGHGLDINSFVVNKNDSQFLLDINLEILKLISNFGLKHTCRQYFDDDQMPVCKIA